MIVPLPVPIEPMREVRTTLLSASLLAIREHGYSDAYFAALDPVHAPAMRSIIAGQWAPAELGMAHYSACDRLGLTPEQQFEMGHHVHQRVQRSLLGTLMRLAKESGATPWTLFGNVGRLFTRMIRGSGIGVWETGPKDARLEVHNCALARYAYCRHAWRGIIAGVAEPVARRVFVTELRDRGTDDRFVAQVSWA
ncbi:MAG: hypothetical protein ACXVCJ_25015 [Polyangiales bacterium]